MRLLDGSRCAIPRPTADRAATRWRRGLARHRVFAVILALAAAVRAVVWLAYRPAMIFPDSERYLLYARRFVGGHWDPDYIRQSGYSILLTPAVAAHNLAVISLAQHLLGLGAGVMIYAALVHAGCRRWLAAMATIPVLFDPLQLDLEQYVLTDTCAVFLFTAALVILAWKRDRIGLAAPAACGALLGITGIIRDSDLVMIVPAALYLAVAVRPWRRLAVRGGTLLGCFLVPVLGYGGWFTAWHHHFALTDFGGAFLYGRISQFADCSGVTLPSYERALCPRQPPAQRNPDFYMWWPQSPQWTFKVPPGTDRDSVTIDFDLRIIEHQPLTYLEVVARDIAYGFSPVRGNGPENYPARYHQFHTYYVHYAHAYQVIRSYGHTRVAVQPALAGFMTSYGRDFHVPGPLLGAGLAVGLIGAAGAGRARGGRWAWTGARARAAQQARRSGLRPACLLFASATLIELGTVAAFATFDWRYQLPQFTLIPLAAGLGVTALLGWRPGPSAPAEHAPAAEAPDTGAQDAKTQDAKTQDTETRDAETQDAEASLTPVHAAPPWPRRARS